jgi:hypothetical protein
LKPAPTTTFPTQWSFVREIRKPSRPSWNLPFLVQVFSFAQGNGFGSAAVYTKEKKRRSYCDIELDTR